MWLVSHLLNLWHSIPVSPFQNVSYTLSTLSLSLLLEYRWFLGATRYYVEHHQVRLVTYLAAKTLCGRFIFSSLASFINSFIELKSFPRRSGFSYCKTNLGQVHSYSLFDIVILAFWNENFKIIIMIRQVKDSAMSFQNNNNYENFKTHYHVLKLW